MIVYKRILFFAAENKLPILTNDQRKIVGMRVADTFMNFPNKGTMRYDLCESVEPEGTFKVMSYPRTFSPQIDKIIADFYKEITPKPPKKRIPLYSARPKNFSHK